MQIILEAHAYAPELNTAYVGPTRTPVRVPGCKTIKEVRQKHFSALKRPGRFITISSHYPGKNSWLNSSISGLCFDQETLLEALRVFRKKLAFNENPVVKIHSRLIG